MKRFLLLASIVSALVFSSCHKEISCPIDKEEPPVTEFPKLLKKMTLTRSGLVTLYYLNYDANKKLVSIKSDDNSRTQNFAYNAVGQLMEWIDENKDFKTVYQFTYINRLPVAGVSQNWEKRPNQPDRLMTVSQLAYTVVNKQITKVKYSSPGIIVNSKLGYNAEGNLAKIEEESSYTEVRTYGTNRPVYPSVSDFALVHQHLWLFGGKNELLTTDRYLSGNLSSTSTTQYTCDDDGYVLTAAYGFNKWVFEYE